MGVGTGQRCKSPQSRLRRGAANQSRGHNANIDYTVYVKGKHLSYQRGKRNTNPNTSLLKIEGVDDPKAAK